MTRTISRHLHPRALHEKGLAIAVSGLLNMYRNRYDLDTSLDQSIDKGERFPSLVELTAYRAIQDTLVKTTRQGPPSKATFNIDIKEETPLVTVTVGGNSFSTEDLPPASFDDVREWIRQLDGTMTKTPLSGCHLEMTVELPLPISPLPS